MIDLLKFLAEWTLVGFVLAVVFGVMCHQIDKEERERDEFGPLG
jgi:hypothetical protein